MKKLMYLFLFSTIFISCSNLNDKLENALTKEIGKEPTKNELQTNEKTQTIIWKDVSDEKLIIIKNSVDKTFGSLPTNESHNEEIGNFDSKDNYTCSGIKSSYRYENSEFKVDLVLIHKVVTNKIESMPGFFENRYSTDYTKPIDVELIIVTK